MPASPHPKQTRNTLEREKNMKKNIAVITGGYSPEYQISLNSAREMGKALDKTKYNVFTVIISLDKWVVRLKEREYPVSRDRFTFKMERKEISFDCALMAIHGTPGEDGKMQAYFDMVNLPYTSTGFFSSALSFNKFACKSFLNEFGILSANAVLLREDQDCNIEEIGRRLGFPCFIKPNNSGSSFGISKVHSPEMLQEAINKAFTEDTEIIVENFIQGTEVSCGLVKTRDEIHIFPLTEIVSHKDFFDYEAKYSNGLAEEITPARIDSALEKQCKELSSRIYDHLDCRGIVRIDYILSDNKPWFLEINTVPGMSAESIIPQQIKAYGNSTGEILEKVIEDCLSRSGQ